MTAISYKEYLPTVELRRFVECYWSSKGKLNSSYLTSRIYPDGCMDIIFNFGDTLHTINTNQKTENTNNVFVVGNMTVSSRVGYCGDIDLFGIRFKPFGIYPMLGMPLNRLTDLSANVFDISKSITQQLFDKLTEQNNLERTNILNIYLNSFYHNIGQQENRISHAVERIINTTGRISISGLADECNWSVRQMERVFNVRVGVTPKMLARTYRFRRLKQIIDSNSSSLLDISYDLGLTDNSHLTREFKQFAGITPQEYRSK